jgi:hypothetical protein
MMRKNKLKVQILVGKVMASVFWYSEGIMSVEFLKRGATVSAEQYEQMLKKLK